MKVRELLGKEVIDADAKVVGKIEDVDLDVSKAAIRSIVLKSGLTKKLSVSPQDVEKIGDKVVLKVTMDKIRKA